MKRQLHAYIYIYSIYIKWTESPCWFPLNHHCLRQRLHVGRPQKHQHHGDQHLGRRAGRADQENIANLNHPRFKLENFTFVYSACFILVYLVACLYILHIYLKSYKTITTNGFIFIYTQGALHIQSICNWVQLEVHTRGFGRIDHKKSPYQIWEGKAFHHGHKSNTRACGRANPFPITLENEPGTSDHVQV